MYFNRIFEINRSSIEKHFLKRMPKRNNIKRKFEFKNHDLEEKKVT